MKFVGLTYAVFLLVSPALAQQAQQEDVFKLNVDVNLVEVHVNVVDNRDRPVGNLGKENFRLFEDQQVAVIVLTSLVFGLDLAFSKAVVHVIGNK